MKVIIAGVTGRAGREALKSCLDNDRITKLVVLTRRGLSGEIESHPKVDLVLHQDFTQYSEYLIQRLQGAEACIWAIGPRPEDDKNTLRSVGVDLPIAAAQVLCDRLANRIPAGVKFRFVYCSSKHTEKSKKTLMFTTDTRKLANDLEKGIANIVTKNKDIFEAYTLRPATFAAINAATQPHAAPASRKLVSGSGHGPTTVIEPSHVGRAMAVVASDGWKEKTVENEAIMKLSN